MYVLRAMCLCLAVVVVFSDNSSDISKIRMWRKEVLKSCVLETKLSKVAFKTFLENSLVPHTQPEKCLIGCFMRKINMISNGIMSVEEISRVSTEQMGKYQSVVNQLKSLVQFCVNRAQLAGTDECTLAGVYSDCMTEEQKKINWQELYKEH